MATDGGFLILDGEVLCGCVWWLTCCGRGELCCDSVGAETVRWEDCWTDVVVDVVVGVWLVSLEI